MMKYFVCYIFYNHLVIVFIWSLFFTLTILLHVAECWTGPDDTKYDAEGPSDQCVSFDEKTCQKSDKMCAGKKHADFVYYIDTPEHTKPAEEVAEELKAAAELLKKQAKKQAKHSKAKAKKGKTGKLIIYK